MSAGEGTGSTELRRSNAPAVRNCVGRTHRQYGIATGGDPSRLEKAGRSRICLSVNGKILKADCGFGLDDSKKHFCSDAQMPRSIKTALDIMVLTIQGLSPLPIRGLSPLLRKE